MSLRVGIVLGGGGIVGMAFHAGVLSAIAEATGWDPREAEIIVGTSAGAASAAELRARLSPDDMAARRVGTPFSAEGEQLLRSLGPAPVPTVQTADVDVEASREAYRHLFEQATTRPGSVRLSLLLSAALSPGSLSLEWLASSIRWLHGGSAWPEKAMWLCAVRLDTGRRILFGSPDAPDADVGDAVAASCSLPGVWAPTRIDGVWYVDGGAYSPTNLDVLAGLPLDLVLVSAPMCISPSCPKDTWDRLVRADYRHALEGEAMELHASRIPVEIFEPSPEDLESMGTLASDHQLQEWRCGDVARQVRVTTLRRLARQGLPGLAVRVRSRPVATPSAVTRSTPSLRRSIRGPSQPRQLPG